jgi:hypothetical protein
MRYEAYSIDKRIHNHNTWECSGIHITHGHYFATYATCATVTDPIFVMTDRNCHWPCLDVVSLQVGRCRSFQCNTSDVMQASFGSLNVFHALTSKSKDTIVRHVRRKTSAADWTFLKVFVGIPS